MDDAGLLREYAGTKSEAAFRTLVQRYVPLVYSAALRQVGDPALAEDVTQVVFILLARKASQLPEKTLLAGWLYRSARHTAARALRNEHRRRRREQELFLMQTGESNSLWDQMAPYLDEAMASLGDVDRGAVLLRYFQNKSLWEVGQALGMKEDTAQKRVSRAVGKLRRLLLKRGVAVSAVAVTGFLATHAAQLAPEELGASVAAAALSKAAVSTPVYALLQEAVRQSLWPNLATPAMAALVIAGVTGAVMRFWPKHAPEPPSYTFQSKIVFHPRPAPRLATQSTMPAPSPEPVANLASVAPPLLSPPVPPPRVAVLPPRPVSPPSVAGVTNAPSSASSFAANESAAGQSPDAGGTPEPPPGADNSYSVAGQQPYPFGYGIGQNYLRPAAAVQPVLVYNRAVWVPAQAWRPVPAAGPPLRVIARGTTKK